MHKQLENLLKAEIDPGFVKRAEFIFEIIEKRKPLRILDVGCGRGFYLKALSLYSFPKEIHGVDVEDSYLALAKRLCSDKRVKIKKANIYDLPYPSNYFDFAICTEVLDHLTHDLKGLSELHRVLKKNGILLVTVPNRNFPFLWDPLNWILMRFFTTHINKDIWWLAGIWADHQRLYEEGGVAQLARKVGFELIAVKRAITYCLPFSHFLIYGLGKNLVERFKLYELSRFGQRRNILAYVIAYFSQLPSRFDPRNSTSTSSTNLMFRLKKA